MPGFIAEAARQAIVPRRNVYNWLRNDPLFREVFNEVKETFIDFAKCKLLEKIEKGNVRAIIFYLRTYAKDRGYW